VKVIRAAMDEIYSVIGQMVGSVFRHGLPLTDKIAARTALTNFVLHIHPVRVRRSWIRMSYTLCLGGLSFFLFIVLTVTGLFLMFYYVPSTLHRFYVMHVVGLPLAAFLLMVIHFWRVRKDGFSGGL